MWLIGERHDNKSDDLLRANPNHSSKAWRPLRRSRKGKLRDEDDEDSSSAESDDGDESGDADEPSAESDEEDGSEEVYYDEDEEVETDALGNTIPKKKAQADPPEANGEGREEQEEESVETIEKGAAGLSTEDRA